MTLHVPHSSVVLDEMRLRFRECDLYFTDTVESITEYIPENVLGVPTEREMSVLDKGLPVYRALVARNDCAYQPRDNDENEESLDEPESSSSFQM
jgi:hypothetical protein